MLVPSRRRGSEILDDPATDPAVRERSLHDVRRSNVLLGGLRALQTETGTTFDGNWSWAPYLIALAGAGVVLAFVGRGMGKRKS